MNGNGKGIFEQTVADPEMLKRLNETTDPREKVGLIMELGEKYGWPVIKDTVRRHLASAMEQDSPGNQNGD